MPLFRNKTKYDYRNDFLPQGGKFRHLDRIADLNKVVVREPKMPESTVVFLPYPKFDQPDCKSRGLVYDDLTDPTDARSYGPWLASVEGVRHFGKNPVSLLFDNPDDSGFVPLEHHPIYMIYETVIRAVKSKTVVTTPMGSSVSDRWDELLNGVEGQNNSYGCLNQPGPITLAYALVYTLGREQPHAQTGTPLGGAAGDKPVVFMMTKTTSRTMFEAFDAHLEDARVPRDLTGCLAVHFYDRQAGVCTAKAAAAASQAFELGGRRAPAAGAPGQTAQLGGYGVHLTHTLTGRPQDPQLPRDIFVQQAVRTLRPWEEVLRGYTPEQCAQIVANQCGLPMSVLYHAWKSRPEFYTDEIRTAMKNPVSQHFGGRAAPADHGLPHGPTVPPTAGGSAPHASPFGLPTPGFGLPSAPAPAPAPAPAQSVVPAMGYPDASIGEPPGSPPTYVTGPDHGYRPEDEAELDAKFHAALRARQQGAGQ